MSDVSVFETGTIKWFDGAKGFGFVQRSNGGSDVFLHVTAMERAGIRTLNEGQKIQFTVETQRGRQAVGQVETV